jgi:hypothetical protein
MSKTKQTITNSMMLLMLFFVLCWQSSNIFHLNIGIDSISYLDIQFFMILVITSIVLLSVFTYVTTWTIINVSFHLAINIPLQTTYQAFSTIFVQHITKSKRTYQVFQVIRC